MPLRITLQRGIVAGGTTGRAPMTIPETATILLTYAELGARLGISPASAKRRAIRAKWAKHIGNDGRTRVRVPVTALPPETSPETSLETSPVASPAMSPVTDQAALIAELRARLDERTALVNQLRSELDRTRSDLDRARADLDRERMERRTDAERAAEERTQLIEALAQAMKPWWRRLMRR
jgi:hypothetical protein